MITEHPQEKAPSFKSRWSSFPSGGCKVFRYRLFSGVLELWGKCGIDSGDKHQLTSNNRLDHEDARMRAINDASLFLIPLIQIFIVLKWNAERSDTFLRDAFERWQFYLLINSALSCCLVSVECQFLRSNKRRFVEINHLRSVSPCDSYSHIQGLFMYHVKYLPECERAIFNARKDVSRIC